MSRPTAEQPDATEVHEHRFVDHQLRDGRTILHCPGCGTTVIDGREWPAEPDPAEVDGDALRGLTAAFGLVFVAAAVALAVFVRPWSFGHLVGCPALLGVGALLVWLAWSSGSDR